MARITEPAVWLRGSFLLGLMSMTHALSLKGPNRLPVEMSHFLTLVREDKSEPPLPNSIEINCVVTSSGEIPPIGP